MKVCKWSLILVVMGAIAFSSCQQEISNEQNVTAKNDSVYIQSLVILDTTLPAGQDTLFKYQFFYDASKRLSKRVKFEYWSVPPPSLLTKTEDIFTYPGSDTLPSVIYTDVVNYVTPASSYKDTIFFFYQNGVVVKDSANFMGTAFLTEFAKLNTTRYRYIERQHSPFHSMSDTSYCNMTLLNNNLTTEIDSMWNGFTSVWTVVNTQITYDNKPNPFKRLFIHYPTPACPNLRWDDMETCILFTPSNNNVSTSVSSASVDNWTVQYQYGSNGMPAVARLYNLPDVWKAVFKYTSLP